MPLKLYGKIQHPNFLVTKVDASWDDCAFLLDFTKPLIQHRWFGVPRRILGMRLGFQNKWIGFTTDLGVPVIHVLDKRGAFLIHVGVGDPLFEYVIELWKKHKGATPHVQVEGTRSGLGVIADLGTHFPDDC
jgi:hypothetical protein